MTGRERGLLTIAAIAGVLALGLPWTSGTSGYASGGWYVAGSCATTTDAEGYATMDCTPGYLSPGVYMAGTSPQAGYATDIRVWMGVTAVLLVAGLRRGSRKLQAGSLAVAVAGGLTHLNAMPGHLAYAVAVSIVAWVVLRPRAGNFVPT